MKYELQTIPIWKAYNSDHDCPLCYLEAELEKDYRRFFLGNSVMAPDVRVEVNAKGFCRTHYRLLYSGENKLGLALMAQTRLDERRRVFTNIMHTAGHAAGGYSFVPGFLRSLLRGAGRRARAALFPRRHRKALAHSARGTMPETPALDGRSARGESLARDAQALERAAAAIDQENDSCMICERLERSLANYAFSIVTLYRDNPEFQKVFRESKGFCFHHLPLMLRMAEIVLTNDMRKRWMEDLLVSQEQAMADMSSELEELADRFDYRNTESISPELKQALPRALGLLGGEL